MSSDPINAATGAILVKLRPGSVSRLGAAGSKAEVLFENIGKGFGFSSEPEWLALRLDADRPDSAWDLAHARVADQLSVSESEVLHVEPDLIHDIYLDPSHPRTTDFQGLAAADSCNVATDQDASNGKGVGPNSFAWHLEDTFSELRKARDLVSFSDPRTRIAHLDTGYFRGHDCKPKYVATHLERNFVRSDGASSDASDPDNWKFIIDNSGHGTGTIGILAGGSATNHGNEILGGAPDAEVVPLRIADRVVLFRTRAFAEALHYASDQGCDVATMSMGGLPSGLWAETIDHAYRNGLCLVAAAGNNMNGLPTRNLVYPARYDQVIAVCGVMADEKAYASLSGLALEGNYGPDSRMGSAITAYSPNIPWPEYPCSSKVRLNGEGTSAATPQVAAAAALWIEQYKLELPRDWRRVEAVRHALFTSAKARTNKGQFGHGILQAAKALAVRPDLTRPITERNSDWFAFFRVITGLGIAEPPLRERMLSLELMQIWCRNSEVQKLLPEPENTAVSRETLKKVMERIIEDERASLQLKKHIADRYAIVLGKKIRRTAKNSLVVADIPAAFDNDVKIDDPPHRRLRVYSLDPSFSTRLATVRVNQATLRIRWESFDRRGRGEYIEFSDVDAKRKKYFAVDLDDTRLVAQDGHAPSEGNAQFHQQMVYAVVMKTVEHFERSLGRPVLWRPKPNEQKPSDDSVFVRRLIVNPHALYERNAYYSPAEVGLKFGYFDAWGKGLDDMLPGRRIFTCLSHDIIAHETTHAVLDGMQRRFNEPSNPDVLALHEGFADIVALLQHFMMKELLESEIAKTRGDIESESFLGSLAVQFGQAVGGRGALRHAIGVIEDGKWKRFQPDPRLYPTLMAPHARGAVLVGAVFDAFVAIYKQRTADLYRIYTGGTGVLPSGAIHPDLVRRLADEASKSAEHVLNMCIRALDYLPPVDVTFFEYLRALITADLDLVPDDTHNYRVAFIESFRRRGIYPPEGQGFTALSEETLRWGALDDSYFAKQGQEIATRYRQFIDTLKEYADACLYYRGREELFTKTRVFRIKLQSILREAFIASPGFAKELGLDLDLDEKRRFEVHEIRRSSKVSPNGFHVPQIVVSLTQSTRIGSDSTTGTRGHIFRGGSTLIVDLPNSSIRYRIVKDIKSVARLEATAAFQRFLADDPLRTLFLGGGNKEPFAMLHKIDD